MLINLSFHGFDTYTCQILIGPRLSYLCQLYIHIWAKFLDLRQRLRDTAVQALFFSHSRRWSMLVYRGRSRTFKRKSKTSKHMKKKIRSNMAPLILHSGRLVDIVDWRACMEATQAVSVLLSEKRNTYPIPDPHKTYRHPKKLWLENTRAVKASQSTPSDAVDAASLPTLSKRATRFSFSNLSPLKKKSKYTLTSLPHSFYSHHVLLMPHHSWSGPWKVNGPLLHPRQFYNLAFNCMLAQWKEELYSPTRQNCWKCCTMRAPSHHIHSPIRTRKAWAGSAPTPPRFLLAQSQVLKSI